MILTDSPTIANKLSVLNATADIVQERQKGKEGCEKRKNEERDKSNVCQEIIVHSGSIGLRQNCAPKREAVAGSGPAISGRTLLLFSIVVVPPSARASKIASTSSTSLSSTCATPSPTPRSSSSPICSSRTAAYFILSCSPRGDHDLAFCTQSHFSAQTITSVFDRPFRSFEPSEPPQHFTLSLLASLFAALPQATSRSYRVRLPLSLSIHAYPFCRHESFQVNTGYRYQQTFRTVLGFRSPAGYLSTADANTLTRSAHEQFVSKEPPSTERNSIDFSNTGAFRLTLSYKKKHRSRTNVPA